MGLLGCFLSLRVRDPSMLITLAFWAGSIQTLLSLGCFDPQGLAQHAIWYLKDPAPVHPSGPDPIKVRSRPIVDLPSWPFLDPSFNAEKINSAKLRRKTLADF